MESPADQTWFLRKHEDGTTFGPLTLAQLAQWAGSAQIAPHDLISTDQVNWMKAPMLPELAMDWIVEVTSERLYGPTTLGAIRDFLQLGEITEDNFVINACNATRQQVRNIVPLLAGLPVSENTQTADEKATVPGASGISVSPHDRIRELEDALREERRALAEVEQRYRELETRYNDLVNAAAASEP